jgi:lipoprotein-anchoring transpeptidase ErfK/SrfK
VPGHTPLGSQTVLLIVRHHGHTGWALVPGSARPREERVDLRDLVLRWTRVAIRIDLADLTMTLRDGTRVLASWPVAAGRPQSPTPTGTFSVTDRVVFTQGGPYGDFALGLSARQTVGLPAGWAGGNQIAIHGTDHPSSIGSYASLGCIRVGEPALAVLRRTVPLGAPVTIA